MPHWLADLFGPGTWGTGGNMVAWVICGSIGFGWLYVKQKAQHLERMRQADRQHEDMKQHVTDSVAANSESEGR